MADSIAGLLNPARLLFDLQRGNEIAQSISGCLVPEVIAGRVTDGLVAKFDCAFARIWLLEPDQAILKLVASSGMYTHINGSFARVPVGTYKVGKIAQNGVAFLSNNLAEEPWVGNREWAIANNIQGFAGYPLAIQGRVVGVLATFSHHALEPEFLEVLQTLCTMVSIALETALQHQKERQTWQSSAQSPAFSQLALSDQLASILSTARLTLVGTEQSLPLSLTYVFLRAAEILNQIQCAYCRLIYNLDAIALEAIVPASPATLEPPDQRLKSTFKELMFSVSCLGGMLQTQMDENQRAIQVLVQLPRLDRAVGKRLRIQCESPILQMAFTHLAVLAGLTVGEQVDESLPLLTDSSTFRPAQRVLWVHKGNQAIPKGIKAKIDLSITPTQLREAVDAVVRGQTWGLKATEFPAPLSERELEMMTLLTQGLRDRDIANQLMISESTVKFHINNILTKLQARTRYQALHQAIVNGWI